MEPDRRGRKAGKGAFPLFKRGLISFFDYYNYTTNIDLSIYLTEGYDR